ncbi:hypothetical protein H0E87_016684 [Populus deltoides]|uniref:Uncharacterized protein n=1 Tax=Populus deltoides TaxID=3696 RepID=A0A8T2YA28_POPDE|nr:hypothetical protein H0E87_016684 [Populus deltoides]
MCGFMEYDDWYFVYRTDRGEGALIFSWTCEEKEGHVVNLRVVLCGQLHAFSVKADRGTAFLDVYAKSGYCISVGTAFLDVYVEEASCILKAVSFCLGNQSFMRRAWCCLLEGRKWGLIQSVYDINFGSFD